jgi:putative phosphoesterase
MCGASWTDCEPEVGAVILGILSDTHGRAPETALVLQAAGATAFVHCGDVGDGAVLEVLAGQKAWFVWGNTDDPGPLLTGHALSLGLSPPTGVPLRLSLADRCLLVFHGHEPEFSRLIDLSEGKGGPRASAALAGVDYVLFGHTHRPQDIRIESVRFVNPGALHRAHPRTVATLDLATDELRFWPVSSRAVGGAGR